VVKLYFLSIQFHIRQKFLKNSQNHIPYRLKMCAIPHVSLYTQQFFRIIRALTSSTQKLNPLYIFLFGIVLAALNTKIIIEQTLSLYLKIFSLFKVLILLLSQYIPQIVGGNLLKAKLMWAIYWESDLLFP